MLRNIRIKKVKIYRNVFQPAASFLVFRSVTRLRAWLAVIRILAENFMRSGRERLFCCQFGNTFYRIVITEDTAVMICDNNVKRLVHEIQMRITTGFLRGCLTETIDRMPIDMRPLGTPVSRCCVYKSRAIIKYRAMAVLGFGTEDETDELVPLSEYALRALNRGDVDTRILSVIAPACSGCPQTDITSATHAAAAWLILASLTVQENVFRYLTAVPR